MNEKRNSRAFNYDRYFLLTIKKTAMLGGVWLLSVLLHNAVYALTGFYLSSPFEEPFFFILAVVVIPLYTLVSLVYTIIRKSLTNLPFNKK